MPSPFWNIEDVMEYLQIHSRTTMYKLLKEGFPHAKIGKKLIFRPQDVDAWLEQKITSKPQNMRAKRKPLP